MGLSSDAPTSKMAGMGVAEGDETGVATRVAGGPSPVAALLETHPTASSPTRRASAARGREEA
jgi:hypothetical protein